MKPKRKAFSYEAIVSDLKRRIADGEWQKGERLPSLTVLAQAYPQSLMTLYKALKRLEESGYISMEQGRGTFVRRTRSPRRVAILANADIFRHSYVPFVFQAVQHAHAFFVRVGMDAQFYCEDMLNETGLPAGLLHELESGKLAGILSIDARFTSRYMLRDEWKRIAVPVVNLGASPASHTIYVDRRVFIERATALAAQRGCSRLALMERDEHLREHLDCFNDVCLRHGIQACPHPARMPSPELSFEEYGFDLMQRLWRADPRPDMVIVPDDVIAKGVAQAALMLRLSVPRDLTVIAMTNRGARFFYPVSVVRYDVDVEALVARAARMLLDLMAGVKIAPQTVLMPPLAPDDFHPGAGEDVGSAVVFHKQGALVQVER